MPPGPYQVELFPGYRQQRDVSVWRRSADTEAGGGLNMSPLIELMKTQAPTKIHKGN